MSRTRDPTSPAGARRRSAARTRIVGWVLLLVLGSLAVVTSLTWLVLVEETQRRIDAALTAEADALGGTVRSGVDPVTGRPAATVDDLLRSVVTTHTVRPNERLLGYLDGQPRWESPLPDGSAGLLGDVGLTGAAAGAATAAGKGAPASVGDGPSSVDEAPTAVGHAPTSVGEVRWVALPVDVAGDPRRGSLVVAYLAEPDRAFVRDAVRLMLLVGAGTAVLATGAASLIAGRILRPIADVAATARTITGTNLSRRVPQRGARTDEIAELAGTLNAMLDRVQRGVQAQRRFVDDAGHELRTPITIVRGHLDVLDPHDPRDVSDTVGLVDDELDRMNRLVSDMLSLTKAEQPSLLQRERVDVAAFTAELFDKLTRLAPREWRLESVADGTAVIDRQRITQAVVALADNATRVTGPGGRIALGTDVDGRMLRISVADDGPGIDPAERARVFRRFARGDAGPRSDGAGLGLSIVQAIATTHGGHVLLDSVPGSGATFTIELPVGPA